MNIVETKIPGLEIIVPHEPIKPGDCIRQKGFEMFPMSNPTIGLYGKKRSGKTTTLYNIISRCVSPQDKVVLFCQTFDVDDGWKNIKKLMDTRGISYINFTDVSGKTQDNVKYDNVKDLLTLLKSNKPKNRYFVILDDMNKEQIRSKSIDNLSKTFRHYNGTLIVSTQAPFDMLPSTRSQLEFILLYPHLPEDKVKKLHQDWDLTLDYDRFQALYNDTTSEPHTFLYIQRIPDCKYRKNFDVMLNIHEA